MPGRRLRFSLRLFLLLMLLCAAAMGWFAVAYLQPYREEAAAIARLSRLGGTFGLTPREPQWIWRTFGNGIARQADFLVVSNLPIGDEEAHQIAALESLKDLEMDRTRFTDAGIQQLGGLVQLRGLKMRHIAVSHPPIGRMSKLIFLDLAFTQVATLSTSSMGSLESLDLRGTRINDATLESFAPMPALRALDISGDAERRMRITDRGVAHLTKEKFPNLTRIFLHHTEVTPVGLKALSERFPGAGIYQDEPNVKPQ
jgi:hypothetical protein